MAIIMMPHAYCDGDEDFCPLEGEAVTDWPACSKATAIEALRGWGWLVRGTKHYCPDCAKRMVATGKGRKE